MARPLPRGRLARSGQGVSRPTPGMGVQAHTHGDCPGLGWGVSRPRPEGCIPACTEADTPSQQTATAAGGTHPTGMHSCFMYDFACEKKKLKIVFHTCLPLFIRSNQALCRTNAHIIEIHAKKKLCRTLAKQNT